MERSIGAALVCTIWLAMTASAAQPDADGQVRVTLDLTDGSRLIGKAADKMLKLHSELGDLDVPVSRLLTIEAQEDGSWTLDFRNGDTLTGRLDLKAVQLDASFGKVTVDLILIERIDVDVDVEEEDGMADVRETLIYQDRANGLTWYRNPDNGHYYALTRHMSWPQAEARARELGGVLACISNEAENKWLARTFAVNDMHIGLTDREQDGVWKWLTDERFHYENWDRGEPSNEDGNEPYVEMRRSGAWNDHRVDTCPGVVERRTRPPGVIRIDEAPPRHDDYNDHPLLME